MSQQFSPSTEEFKKLLKEYAQYSVNLKDWIYEFLTSAMGQSPSQWFFEAVYKDAHSPFIYWIKEKPGLVVYETESSDQENIEDIILEFGLKRDGPILRIGRNPISSGQLQDLKGRRSQFNYEFLESKGVFRPKWTGVKK